MTTTLDAPATPAHELYETLLISHYHTGFRLKNNRLTQLNADGWRVVACCNAGLFVGGMVLTLERPASMNTAPPVDPKQTNFFWQPSAWRRLFS